MQKHDYIAIQHLFALSVFSHATVPQDYKQESFLVYSKSYRKHELNPCTAEALHIKADMFNDKHIARLVPENISFGLILK